MTSGRARGGILRTLAVACAPSLIVLALVATMWRAGPRDFVPLWNDEIIYWSETAAFARAGFHAGYFTVAERPAAAAFSHFGSHGPYAAALYGTVARATGWRPYSGYLMHLVLIPLCAAVWLLAVRAEDWRGPALLVATFWPLLFYLPSNMEEPLHFGVAFLLAALCEWRTGATTRGAAGVLLFVLACLTRPTWALAIPAVMWGADPATRRRTIAFILAPVAFGLAFLAVTRAAAPYPYTSWLVDVVPHPALALRLMLQRTWMDARAFVSIHQQGYIVAQRVEIVVLIVAAATMRHVVAPASRWRVTAALLAIVPVFIAMLATADIESGREFRVLAPHLFLALLLLAGIAPRWSLVPGLANLVVLVALLPAFHRLHDGRFGDGGRPRRFARALGGSVAFDGARRSGWDDTVLMHVDAVQPPLAGLPAGIGISFVLDWKDQPLPPRSRYLLLRRRDAAVRRRLHLARLADTELGTLYRNLDAR